MPVWFQLTLALIEKDPQKFSLTLSPLEFVTLSQLVMLNGNVVEPLMPLHAPPIVIVRAVVDVLGADPTVRVELSVAVFAVLSIAVTSAK